MATLNKIKDFVANRLDRPFDDMFKEEVKFAFISELSLLMRRSIDANGLDKTYLAKFNVPMMLVDSLDSNQVTGDKKVLRSVNKVPIPIRYKTPYPFVFVGTLDDIPFGYSIGYEAPFTNELPYIGKAITYDYVNQYIFLNNTVKPNLIKVIAPYANFSLIPANGNGESGILYDDDMELPFPEDLINTVIKSLLEGVFGNLDSKDKIEATHLDNQ